MPSAFIKRKYPARCKKEAKQYKINRRERLNFEIWRRSPDYVPRTHRYKSLELPFPSSDVICGICKCPETGRRHHRDHSHETGKFRSLLCHHCNVGLGHFKENPELLRTAIAYLEHHAQPHIVAAAVPYVHIY